MLRLAAEPDRARRSVASAADGDLFDQ